MTTAEAMPSEAPFPAIRPIECTPWCTDGDGHATCVSRRDQVCWGTSNYVELSLEECEVNKGEKPGSYLFWPSIIGPCAYRGFNQQPVVYLHFTLANRRHDHVLDESCKLTAAEARELAAHLIAVAEMIGGAPAQ
ncbi:hypothetical protein [Mycolicibacterium sphagni]|uniref:Uncharacterized protein n=1 Tax=Mycolicibacterium sphagni TaxID=1786 RepID=A0A255DTB5_9MYCO|nr:hypothetical protein [Mycolicibacterium sphagni]OYN78893.1 hypothetical protein CG716_13570 [Mycolicibacterium sphagni]